MGVYVKKGRKLVDWGAIEALYRKGVLSNTQICTQYAIDYQHSQTYSQTITEGAIRKQAKIKGWQRDIADKVQEKVREKLVRCEVRNSTLDEAEIIEEAAEKGVQIVLRHQKEILDIVEHEESLIRELKELNAKKGVSESGDIVRLKERSSILRDITEIRAKRIAMERVANGVDESDAPNKNRIVSLSLDFLKP